MPLVAVTRLRLRSFRYLPQFHWFAMISMRQVTRAPGFIAGQILREPWLGFWTVTLWTDEASMKVFRNSGAHRRAMPHLMEWCDEASYAHSMQDGKELPSLEQAQQQMVAAGRVSKVRYPSAAHRGGRVAPAPDALRPGSILRPAR